MRYRARHSRIVDCGFIFGDAEKEHSVALMRKLEDFLSLRVVTYVVMCNQFHLFVEEPMRRSERDWIATRVSSGCPTIPTPCGH